MYVCCTEDKKGGVDRSSTVIAKEPEGKANNSRESEKRLRFDVSPFIYYICNRICIYVHVYICIYIYTYRALLVNVPWSHWSLSHPRFQPRLRPAERKTSGLRVVIKRKRKTRALCKKLDNLKKKKKIIERNVFARVPRKYETRDSRKNLPYILYNLSQLL